jgi:alpha-tubulin suppressor-like RCC1 family protein
MAAKIKTISCGGEHMIAVLQNNKVLGWGRNDKGQLGLGSLFSPAKKPTEIDDLGNHTCKDVYCGADFSVILTENKTLLVAGSMEWGRFGLSKSHREGY